MIKIISGYKTTIALFIKLEKDDNTAIYRRWCYDFSSYRSYFPKLYCDARNWCDVFT
ncbi:hypothetical protein THZB04_10751 [Vibrio owensii]|nr:hypothetical protein THZB04_10751 [Vibrio owensii]